ncbi:ATP-binding cassette domain-containing protein [Bdellovibrionota bacterium FG-2]
MSATDLGLQVKGFQKKMEHFDLRADFEIPHGARAVLLGKSGSGKTTLLRVLAGIERTDAGAVVLAGVKISLLPPQKREIGVIVQEQALFPALNVIENAAFGLRMRGVSPDERIAMAKPWLERVGLTKHAFTSVTTLSGGERQRVAFIRALIWKPKLLLLDEPFSALDAELRTTLRQELLDLHKQWPVPVLLVTHDAEDAAALATVKFQIQTNLAAEGREQRVVTQAFSS